LVGIAAGAAVAVAAAGVAAWFLLRPASAEEAARVYLAALADGDWEAIDGMRADQLPDDAEQVTADAFLTAAGYAREPRIERVGEERAGRVDVQAAAEIDGASREIVFTLARAGSDWKLAGEDYLASLTVHAAIEGGTALAAVRIGDAVAPTETPVALLPAVYDVTAAPPDFLEGGAVIGVSSDQPATVEVAASFSPQAAAHAQEQLDVYAEACTQPATEVPDHCGLIVPWQADLAELERIAFRVERLPEVTLSPAGTSFDATGGIVVATAHGLRRDGTPGSFTYRADDWALRGSIRISGDELVLAVR
jgi:predicted 3-demethylubiquinone-9 3-methyltransferase (glyoxalase superfamily)